MVVKFGLLHTTVKKGAKTNSAFSQLIENFEYVAKFPYCVLMFAEIRSVPVSCLTSI